MATDFRRDWGGQVVSGIAGQTGLTPAQVQAYLDAQGIDPVSLLENPGRVPGIISAIGQIPEGMAPVSSVEELVRQTSPEAIGLIKSGVEGAIGRIGQGTDAALQAFQGFMTPGALEEQSALLGLAGLAAQEQAIAGIPVSEAQREAQASQMRQQQRQAAAAGDLGSGATLLGSQQLAGAQEAQNIFNRLAELSGLTSESARVASSMSGLKEQGMSDIAGLLYGVGPAAASIRLGGAASIAGARESAAELAGLQGIADANRRSSNISQLAQLAGQVDWGQMFGGSQPSPYAPPSFNAPAPGMGSSAAIPGQAPTVYY